MKQTLSTSQAADLLASDDNANWSYAGACALIEYLDDLGDDLGEEFEFDRVAIRCEYSEYDGLLEWAQSHWGGKLPSWEIFDDTSVVEDWIREHITDQGGTLVEFDGGVIVSEF